MTRRLRLTLAYDGTEFAGSQIQPGRRTVQGVVAAAVARLEGRAARVTLAGRTDTGVHAAGQVGHVDVTRQWDGERWRRALNAILPPDVRVTNADHVAADFHARYDARWRQYRYRVWNGTVQFPLQRWMEWHVIRPLDVAAMDAAARSFIGERSFAAFAGDGRGTPESRAATVRTVRRAEWTAARCQEPIPGDALLFTIEANGFLPHMVRNMVGALVVVGRGDAPVEWIEEVVRGADRRHAAPPAPPHGLTLWRVWYEDE